MSVHDIIIHKQLDQDFCTAICISLGNFKNDNSTTKQPETGKMKTICCPAIQDSKTIFISAYINFSCIVFYECSNISQIFFKNIYRKEIDYLIVKSFTGCNSGLISYSKTVWNL